MRLIAALVLAVTMVAVSGAHSTSPDVIARNVRSHQSGNTLPGVAPGASTGPASVRALAPPAQVVALRDHWQSEGDWYQSTLRDAGAAHSIVAGARLAGIALDNLPAARPVSLPTLPAELAGPIGDLAAEVALASRRDRAALHGTPTELAQYLALGAEFQAAGSNPARQESLRVQLLARRSMVDSRAQASAAHSLALAIDRDLPLLQRASRTLKAAPSAARVGCDVLDEAPVLCVGSASDHLYPVGSDYALQITLGGHNLYRNRAAGAAAGAAVMIDLGSDSTFSPDLDSYPHDSGHSCLGSGSIGIGFAILAATTSKIALDSAAASACGGAAFAGVGLLLDNSVSSTWSLGHRYAVGAGYAQLPGLGIAVRHGALTATVSNNVDLPEASIVQVASGFGAGEAYGTGLFYGGGGDLDLRVESILRVGAVRWRFPSAAQADGFGIGVEGVGGLFLGQGGSHHLTLTARVGENVTLGASSAATRGIGAGLEGLGVAFDLGTTSTFTASATHTGGDISPNPSTPGAIVEAIGHGSVGGVGILLRPGPATFSVAAHEGTTEGRGQAATVVAEGAGDDGIGILSQAGGDANFSTSATVAAETGSDSHAPAGDVELVTQGAGHGAGVGLLEAAGRYNTGYRAIASRTLDGRSLTGSMFTESQGAGDPPDPATLGSTTFAGTPGLGLLIDDGGCDTFFSAPGGTVEAGARGATMWVDSSGLGGGVDGGSSSPCA